MGIDGMYNRDDRFRSTVNNYMMYKSQNLQDDLGPYEEIVDDNDITIDINKIKQATISFIMSLRRLLENKFWKDHTDLQKFIRLKLPPPPKDYVPPPPKDYVSSFSFSFHSIPVQLESLTERYIKDVNAELKKWDELKNPKVWDGVGEKFKKLLDTDRTIDKCFSNVDNAKAILQRATELKGGKKKSRKSKRGKANKSKKYRKK